MNMNHPKQPNSAAAFSLVELTLSLGIISFAFVGVLGLLPAGMNVFRDSMNASTGAQIVQRVLTEAQQTNFSVLTTGNVQQPGTQPPPPPYHDFIPIRHFDDEGTELQPDQTNKSLYHVRAVVQNLPKFPDGSGKNTIEMNDLATVIVQVAVNPGQRPLAVDGTTLLWKDSPSVRIQSFPVLVSHHD